MTRALDLFTTFVHRREDGSAMPVAWHADFWRTLAMREGDVVVGARHGNEPGDFHPDEWEMHPRGDEILHLLTGAIDAIFDEPEGERVTPLRGGDTCIVPAWRVAPTRHPGAERPAVHHARSRDAAPAGHDAALTLRAHAPHEEP